MAAGTTVLTAYLFDTCFEDPAPVGGVLIPVSDLAILGPYLALLVVAAVTVVVARWSKRNN